MARDTLYLSKVNDVYIRVQSEPSVAQELADHFSFMSPNARFDPRVKNKYWDGKIRLYNPLTGLIYYGLIDKIVEFAQQHDYEIVTDGTVKKCKDDVTDFLASFESTKEPREYQIEAFKYAVRYNRGIFLSPTSSGKSLMIYMLSCYYQQERKLIIVPTVQLVFQLKSDFEEYAGNGLSIHCITAGVDKQTTEDIVISTWQSIYKMPKKWFAQFGVVIGDEVHRFEAKSLKTIMEKMLDTKYRFGYTGTLTGTLTNEMTLEGLFGKIRTVTTITELQEQNYVAKLKIKALILKHDVQSCKDAAKFNYQDEVKFINNHRKRNNFIAKLAVECDKNTLVLFRNIDHGKLLYDKIKSYSLFSRDVYLIYGGIDGEDREEIRRVLEFKSNAILVASYGTFSTGVNVPNLHYVMLGAPSKSRVTVLQSIGRGLRLHDEKDFLTVYDIADDLRLKTKANYTLQHFSERYTIYNEQGFNCMLYNINLTE